MSSTNLATSPPTVIVSTRSVEAAGRARIDDFPVICVVVVQFYNLVDGGASKHGSFENNGKTCWLSNGATGCYFKFGSRLDVGVTAADRKICVIADGQIDEIAGNLHSSRDINRIGTYSTTRLHNKISTRAWSLGCKRKQVSSR